MKYDKSKASSHAEFFFNYDGGGVHLSAGAYEGQRRCQIL